MLKNFSPQSLGLNGRQSELIELALTYAFRGMDVDMYEMLRRSQRTSLDDAAKYLRSASIALGGFNLEVNLDADDDAFTSQLGAVHPVAELAKELGATRAYTVLPAATDRLPYHEYFQTQTGRLGQIADVLGAQGIKLGVTFQAAAGLADGKQFEFMRKVEGLVALVRSAGNSNVGLVIDTWDWAVGDGAMDQVSELKAGEIVAVRLGSLPADVDASKAKVSDRILPTLQGTINHVNLIKHLESIGFDGPVSPSASPLQYKNQTREKTVQDAQEAIDAIFREAGLHVPALPMDTIEDIVYEPTPIIN
ncbi:TIM barrel protein [Stieleria varia]|uniref:Xylose isomerase-like TIM barrel n=1 Tax=Stieleria varia TaxID=2528005 RepID=A0A5C5ZVH2_9BACT|nr:TIM barrel protein [Stieleria varia]TWT91319.1 Xylose isomerase-like TIM barrel [Stieleria varia]